jgi:release factor glutamine methyltransferase
MKGPREGSEVVKKKGSGWTLLELIRFSEGYLRERGVESARHDAERLLAHALGVKRLDLYLQHERVPGEAERARFRELLRRRGAREPLQYLEGTSEFLSLPFRVRPPVAIPRPETEILAEAVEPHLTSPVLEVGVGSGCLLLALLSRNPDLRGEGWDVSEEAVTLAGENARALGLEDRTTLRAGDFLLADPPARRFAALLSNPPYVPSDRIASLSPEVRDHEDPRALDGGGDGLDFCRRLLERAPEWLEEGGVAALEVGDAQVEAVADLLERAGFGDVRRVRDYNRKERVLLAWRRG